MDRIYVFILRNDVWMLILAAMALIWYLSEFLRANHQLKRAVFGLEREKSGQARSNALVFIVGCSAVIGLIVYVNYQIAPTLPAELLRPIATPVLQNTPLSPPTREAAPEPTPTPPLVPTITLAANPGLPPAVDVGQNGGQAIITDTAGAAVNTAITVPTQSIPPTPFIGCNLQLAISAPRTGAVISTPIEFFGTANTSDFGGYKLEANGPQTNGQWASLLGRTIELPVQDSLLGNVNLTAWESGPYLVRLIALDQNQVEAYQCIIQITLENE